MVCARKRAWPTRFDETTLFVCTGTLFDLVAVMWREPPGRVELLARCSEAGRFLCLTRMRRSHRAKDNPPQRR